MIFTDLSVLHTDKIAALASIVGTPHTFNDHKEAIVQTLEALIDSALERASFSSLSSYARDFLTNDDSSTIRNKYDLMNFVSESNQMRVLMTDLRAAWVRSIVAKSGQYQISHEIETTLTIDEIKYIVAERSYESFIEDLSSYNN
jgi:hypothetical protein